MGRRQRFRLLVKVFHSRFFENDTVSPGGGFETNIYQIAGFLIATGWFISYFLMPPFLQLSAAKHTEQTEWAIHSLRMFFTSYSFAIVGFASVFEWDMLFPDRRDFLILGMLPVGLGELLAAKIIALLLLLLMLVASTNVFPILMMIALSMLAPELHGSGFRLILAQVAATGGAALYALLVVAALQGLLIFLLTARFFARVSPWIQTVGMSVMVLSVLLYPIYSMLVKSALEEQRSWPWLLPPVWFAGIYDLILQRGNVYFVALGRHGLLLLAVAAAVAIVTWTYGYGRHCRRALESAALVRASCSRWPTRFIRLPEERAIAEFSFRTLARSGKHRLFLATYLSVGLSFALLFALAVRSGKLVVSQDGMRAFPFVIVFFSISGFRAICQFPAELAANWLFRLTEAEWSEVARRAIRTHALIAGLLPTLAMWSLLELALGEWRYVALHAAFQLMTGALLIEVLFWTFDKVPFTCSYFSGRINLSLLAGVYLYGFTGYSFHLAELERRIETHPGYAFFAFVTGGLLLTVLWRHRRQASSVRFDGEDPLIRSLDLT
jgi:hypothetical protein